jgi:hypothetical protein
MVFYGAEALETAVYAQHDQLWVVPVSAVYGFQSGGFWPIHVGPANPERDENDFCPNIR